MVVDTAGPRNQCGSSFYAANMLEAASQGAGLGRILNALPLQLVERRETRQAL